MKEDLFGRLWYLAHPYTADSSKDIEANVKNANIIAAKLICAGMFVYSPISMTHWIHLEAVRMKLLKESEWELWMNFDDFLITNYCAGAIMSPGWEDSIGCKEEYERFTELRKPIYLLRDVYQLLGIKE